MTPAGPPATYIAGLSNSDLLVLERAILAELKTREIIRSNNAPAGDYAEYLVMRATGGELAPKAQKSWDVLTPDGSRLQVKCRVLTKENRSRQLSPIRSWEFDCLMIVLFDGTFSVTAAAGLDPSVVQPVAVWKEHVNGWIVHARDELLSKGADWTSALQGLIH
jgi:hypothetical protein